MNEYKKYSLQNLENWLHDAMTCGEATPQEIYNTIKSVVEENYHIYKEQVSKAYELIALLNGNGKGHIKEYDEYLKSSSETFSCDKNDPSVECKNAWTSFWEDESDSKKVEKDDCMPPWGHSDMEALRYTEEEMNAMCDNAEKHSKHYYDYSRNDINRKNPFVEKIYESPDGGKTIYSRNKGETEKTLVKEEKPKKWIVNVEIDGASGEYFLSFPDDLLETANLKEGDVVEWIENGNGSFSLKKVNIAHHRV